MQNTGRHLVLRKRNMQSEFAASTMKAKVLAYRKGSPPRNGFRPHDGKPESSSINQIKQPWIPAFRWNGGLQAYPYPILVDAALADFHFL
jgi:hypothetical protein